MNNLVFKLIYKYDNWHNSLTPQKKAQADMLGILFLSLFCAGLVSVIVTFGWLLEFLILVICYVVFGMAKILYKARVDYYKTLDDLNK